MRSDSLDTGPDLAQPKLKGVFSSTVFPGQAPEPPAERYLWFARETIPGTVSIQLLDEHHLPTPRKLPVPKDEFLRDFTLEPDLGYKLLTQRVLMGDYYRNQGMNLEAKIEYQKVLRVDEENIRGNFGLGLAYLALNQIEKGRYAFEKLVRLDESFSAEHKHLFNDFGIALRKRGLFDEALAFYHRAKELCDDDEHLRLNIARAWFEKGDTDMAFLELRACLELNACFREALAFLAYLSRNGITPQKPELREYFQREALKRSEFGSLLED